MNKLYQKSRLWFALAWIAAYVAGTGAADGASSALGIEKSVTLAYLGALTVIAVLWLKKQNLFQKYGLCKPLLPARQLLFYIPLAVMVSCNLWFGVTMNLSPVETALYIGSMLLVGFLEELIFRGFLFCAMAENNRRSAVIVSSLTFGIGHLVNLVNGSGAELLPNLCQVCYAVAAGFLFVTLFEKTKSLVPCILTHSLLNGLSAFAPELTTGQQIFSAAILCAVPVLYIWCLQSRKESN